jgi:beta-glucosidase
MSSFNWIGTQPSCSNNNLLNKVLRDEWGYVGMVETDYDGSYGYMISDKCVRNGNDLMLGFASAASNQFTDTSATATLAMRKACKNILYTVANSGYYAVAEDPSTSGSNALNSLLMKINIPIAIVLVALEALFVSMWLKGKKKAA